MAKFDPQQITPPPELVAVLRERCQGWSLEIADAYRAGAQFAADALRHEWPEPITDRPPTEADADSSGWVMRLTEGVWRPWKWDETHGDGWLHCVSWQLKPEPSIKERKEVALGWLHPDFDGESLGEKEAAELRALLALVPDDAGVGP